MAASGIPMNGCSREHGFMHNVVYKNYLLILLMIILAFNFTDRMALGIVLQDVKSDLGLSDTQLGFLSGIAFALFYSVMGIPIARWADRGNRVTIIALTTALWSAAVALCGTVGNFAQLLLIRIGVAVGEAGCIPPAHSLIADIFTRAERPRAVGIYTMGAPLSLLVGFFAAGWLNQFYGWRATFMIMGLPGLALAVLAWFTLKEPRRRPLTRDGSALSVTSESAAAPVEHPSLKQVCATLWDNRSFRHMLFCYSVSFFFIYGVLQWQPAFFIRSYGLQTGEVGSWFAVAYGLCGLLGNYSGGVLASRYAADNERLQLQAMTLLFALHGVFSGCVYLVPNQYWAFVLLGFAVLSLTLTNGPFLAIVQTLVPTRMRATSVALVYLFANLIGMGLGPLATGALSDAFMSWAGEESLRYALLALCPGFLWCAWYLWRASQTVADDLAIVQLDDNSAMREEAPESHACVRSSQVPRGTSGNDRQNFVDV
jgi:MFS family permease